MVISSRYTCSAKVWKSWSTDQRKCLKGFVREAKCHLHVDPKCHSEPVSFSLQDASFTGITGGYYLLYTAPVQLSHFRVDEVSFLAFPGPTCHTRDCSHQELHGNLLQFYLNATYCYL